MCDWGSMGQNKVLSRGKTFILMGDSICPWGGVLYITMAFPLSPTNIALFSLVFVAYISQHPPGNTLAVSDHYIWGAKVKG
ncbi:hypothetical protein XELAEV_18002808mg [Xenopus laevis]|nr:hypothetical protein XELAEV_18002808mg [Xenopus laevis]